MKECFVVLGNQLFDKKYLTEFKNSCDFFIQEDMGLCSYFKHHKQKIYYFLLNFSILVLLSKVTELVQVYDF